MSMAAHVVDDRKNSRDERNKKQLNAQLPTRLFDLYLIRLLSLCDLKKQSEKREEEEKSLPCTWNEFTKTKRRENNKKKHTDWINIYKRVKGVPWNQCYLKKKEKNLITFSFFTLFVINFIYCYCYHHCSGRSLWIYFTAFSLINITFCCIYDVCVSRTPICAAPH